MNVAEFHGVQTNEHSNSCAAEHLVAVVRVPASEAIKDIPQVTSK